MGQARVRKEEAKSNGAIPLSGECQSILEGLGESVVLARQAEQNASQSRQRAEQRYDLYLAQCAQGLGLSLENYGFDPSLRSFIPKEEKLSAGRDSGLHKD